MKTTRCGRRLLSSLAVGLTATMTMLAEDAAPLVSTNQVISVSIQAPRIAEPAVPVIATVGESGPAAAPSLTLAGEEPVAVDPTPILTASVGLESPVTRIRETDAEAQRRLEAPTPEKLIERHGAIGFLLHQPEPRNFLDLINPFAPTDFGPGEREIFNRDPNLKPGAHLPRAFVNDVTHEPNLGFFEWAW